MSWITANYISPSENNKEVNTGFLLTKDLITSELILWQYFHYVLLFSVTLGTFGTPDFSVTFYSILIDKHVRNYIKCLTLEDFLAQWFCATHWNFLGCFQKNTDAWVSPITQILCLNGSVMLYCFKTSRCLKTSR